MLVNSEEIRKVVNSAVYDTIKKCNGEKADIVYGNFINNLNRELRKLDVYSDISRSFYSNSGSGRG